MMRLPINQVVCGDSIEVMKDFPAESIDMAVTSPPYWGLRDYGVDGQIGLESHPQEYIDELVKVARQIRRVLKKSGSFYLNLGDTYFGSGGAGGDYNKGGLREGEPKYKQGKPQKSNWLQPKQLMLIPSKVAIALQEDGWILRNDIVWYKPNHMPSSVKDRLTNSWEHVFHFVKSRKYFYDLDAIRKPHKLDANQMEYRKKLWSSRGKDTTFQFSKQKRQKANNSYSIGREHSGYFDTDGSPRFNLKGKNPGDVRKIETTAQFFIEKGSGGNVNLPSPEHPKGKNPGDLINAFQGHPPSNYYRMGESEKGKNPSDLMKFNEKKDVVLSRLWNRFFDAHDEDGVCVVDVGYFWDCMDKTVKLLRPDLFSTPHDFWKINTQPFKGAHFAVFPEKLVKPIIKSSCPKNGIVLDPFCGSGTSCVVAHKLGRRWIGIDLNKEYCELAKERLRKECSQHLGKFCS